MARLFLLCLLLIGPSIVAQSPNEIYQKRLALIIGNSRYSAGMELKNPVNDARAMSETLAALGFDVLQFENLSLEGLKKAIAEFGKKLKGYDVGLFYYAGHGIQYHGHNYMIPVEANLEEEDHVEINCLKADHVLTYMGLAQSKVNLIILDACRNNPFERSWSRSSSSSGLAMMDAPRGTLIAYATSPGSTASDGDGENGLFTSAILKYIKDETLTIEQVFKRVRTEVEEKSNKRQSPWEATSLSGEDLFMARGFNRKKTKSTLTMPSAISAEDLKEAEQLYQSGVQKFGQKLYNDALFDLTHSLELNPYSAETQYSMGRLHYELKMNDQAISDLTRSIALKPEMVIAYVSRATVYYGVNKFQEAADDFAMASEMAPKSAEYRYGRALSLYQMKAYKESIQPFTEVLNINSGNIQARQYRGLCYYFTNEPEKAGEDFKIVLQSQPENKIALLYNALVLAAIKPDQALNALSAVIEVSPEEPMPYIERAIILMKNGDFQGASDDLNKAISLDNQSAKAIFWKGRLFFQGKNWKDALYSMDAVINIDSAFQEAYIWRGFIKMFEDHIPRGSVVENKSEKEKKNDLEKAESVFRDFNTAIKINKNNPEIYYRRSLVNLELLRINDGINDLKQAVAMNPGFTDAWLALGRIKLDQGEFSEASIHLTRCTRLAPENSDVYYWRGESSLKLKFYQQAIADFNKSLALRPGLTKAMISRGNTYLESGDPTNALADYNQALESDIFNVGLIQKKAEAYIQLGNHELAVETADKSINTAESIMQNLNKTKPDLVSGDRKVKIKPADYDKIVSGQVAQANYLKAIAYENMGKRNYALSAIREAIILQPENKLYAAFREKLRVQPEK